MIKSCNFRGVMILIAAHTTPKNVDPAPSEKWKESVLLLSKLNKMLFGYFDPEKLVFRWSNHVIFGVSWFWSQPTRHRRGWFHRAMRIGEIVVGYLIRKYQFNRGVGKTKTESEPGFVFYALLTGAARRTGRACAWPFFAVQRSSASFFKIK